MGGALWGWVGGHFLDRLAPHFGGLRARDDVCVGDLTAGDNVFVFENNVIQPYATIGYDTILWSGNHIGHDARIGNHCFLCSHVAVSGQVTVEDHCFIGVNATIRDGITIGAGSVIGAGAVITKNVAPGSVMKGIPAELSPVPSHRLKAI